MNEKEKNAFHILSNLIEEYSENRLSFDLDKLQNLREEIAINLFYLSAPAAQALSNYDMAEHVRKTKMAEREQFYRNETDADGKRLTVAESQNLARIDCEKEVEDCKESLRQKRRVEIILNATNQILHAISSRLNQIK